MAVKLFRGRRSKNDLALAAIIDRLEAYEKDHPKSKIDLYRHSPYTIHVRILDPDFQGKHYAQRNDDVWKYLDPLDEEITAEIGQLLCITPAEQATSGGNLGFENPHPAFA
jgi:hypothetical protein